VGMETEMCCGRADSPPQPGILSHSPVAGLYTHRYGAGAAFSRPASAP
jgi:hypothetical protein